MNKITMLLTAAILFLSQSTHLYAAERPGYELPSTPVQATTTYTDTKPIIGGFNLIEVEPLRLNAVQPGASVEDSKPRPLTPKELAKQIVTERFGASHFKAFDALVTRESGWNPDAVNKNSGACGLPQALPCSKIQDRSVQGQIEWMVSYIANRYGTPANAWAIWQQQHWY